MAASVQSSHCLLQSELQARLGPDVAVVCTGVDGDPESLWAEEREAIAGAVPKRQREFAAGRQAARAAMQRLNGPAAAIPSNADRSPHWPDGMVGSIAHCSDTCVVVVGRTTQWESIGVDIEANCGIDESLWPIICSPSELSLLGERYSPDNASRVTRLFAAKEAFYKWYYPIEKTMLEFQDVSVNWVSQNMEFEIVVHQFGKDRCFQNGRGQLLIAGSNVVVCFATVKSLNLASESSK